MNRTATKPSTLAKFMWQSGKLDRNRVIVSAWLFLASVIAYNFWRFDSWSSDDTLLYSRPKALASYLSLTGVEGVGSSHLYVLCAQRLALSWKRNVPAESREEYDMVLLVTDPYNLLTHKAASTLRDVGWKLIHVDPLYGKPSASRYLSQNRYTHTAQFTKLLLWTFEGYEHILYLDADMLVVRDLILAISRYNVTEHTLGATHSGDGFHMINAGLLLIHPSVEVYDSMIKASMFTDYNVEYQEQAFLDVYWGNNRTVWLPAQVNEYVTNVSAGCIVLHFLGNNKPWNICPDPIVHTWACNEWSSYD